MSYLLPCPLLHFKGTFFEGLRNLISTFYITAVGFLNFGRFFVEKTLPNTKTPYIICMLRHSESRLWLKKIKNWSESRLRSWKLSESQLWHVRWKKSINVEEEVCNRYSMLFLQHICGINQCFRGEGRTFIFIFVFYNTAKKSLNHWHMYRKYWFNFIEHQNIFFLWTSLFKLRGKSRRWSYIFPQDFLHTC